MEDSQEILLNSLRTSGISIPPGVSTIQNLTPATLFTICSESLCIIDTTLSFPSSLPEDSMADRFKICSDLASAFKHLGFVGDISFHKFLYPSEEDLYKLVRFLVGKLAESSQVRKSLNEKETREVPELKDLRLQTREVKSANVNPGAALVGELNQSSSVLGNLASDADDGVAKSRTGTGDLAKEGWTSEGIGEAHKVDVAGNNESGYEETVALGVNEHYDKHDQKLTSIQGISSEEKEFMDLIAKTSKLQHLKVEHELLKAAVTFTDRPHTDFFIRQLNDQIEARRDKLVKLDAQWNALRRPLEAKMIGLEEALCAIQPMGHDKLQQKKELEVEIESLSAEKKRRGEELSVLSVELEKQPKVASRKSFVLRIKEITKNSRKQEADVERILKETRELQLESNSIQERLNRTYAVVDETIFREARKDPVARQAYRLLTGIHECFEQTADKILSTDRTRREMAYYEAKLATMASRSLNIDKLQADLDAIQKENDILEFRK